MKSRAKEFKMNREYFLKYREKDAINISKAKAIRDTLYDCVNEAESVQDTKIILNKIIEELMGTRGS